MVIGKFKIPSVPATTNKTIRFPNDVVEQVEQAIQGKDCTFSAFVIAAVRSALEDLKQPHKNRKGSKNAETFLLPFLFLCGCFFIPQILRTPPYLPFSVGNT